MADPEGYLDRYLIGNPLCGETYTASGTVGEVWADMVPISPGLAIDRIAQHLADGFSGPIGYAYKMIFEETFEDYTWTGDWKGTGAVLINEDFESW